TTTQALLKLNDLKDELITIGQLIVLPGKTDTAAAASAMPGCWTRRRRRCCAAPTSSTALASAPRAATTPWRQK
ncbi:hypothetical protein, partial [Trichloromonas sp.]|uniref:hypothetical protein n=1 Tax=Trichloromonas sp. TaxID=3069249 RepID=UPI003D816AC0